ncbi:MULTISPECIES: ABC transporter ATP-binding protein [Micromonospora]|uniref:ABC transporter ATP-binding protein n=1 Tax=Micromonospora TaxID=1873 RepID=UPI00076D3438|nr:MULTISPECIES: ABC transporter ATP-binding protein [Micromonospora]KWV30972.1 ABC transporter [Micromonospora rifamycinica]WFE64845.1 ABC transporter ATP-binding protein [Micromonospora sp. WMMD714]
MNRNKDGRMAMSGSVDAVRLGDVRKTYGRGENRVDALRGVTMSFPRGSFTAVMGPSGSGKSTFLHCAAGLDVPSSGSVVLDGKELSGMNENQLTILRRERVGFIFQAFNLMSALNVEQNVGLPYRLSGRRPDRHSVLEVLGRVGLAERRKHLPSELSGGQQQRVAIARALIMRPAVIFADEPTGALDTQTTIEVLQLLRETVSSGGQTIIMVTHDPVAAAAAHRVLFLADGQFIGELEAPTADVVAERMTHLTAWQQNRAPQATGRGGF